MLDDEIIEQLELQNKVLQANNKGLKDKIDELRNKNAELRVDLEVKNAELKAEKEKNEELEKYKRKHTLIKHNYVSKDKIKAKIEFIKKLNEKIYYEENVISILQELLMEE